MTNVSSASSVTGFNVSSLIVSLLIGAVILLLLAGLVRRTSLSHLT